MLGRDGVGGRPGCFMKTWCRQFRKRRRLRLGSLSNQISSPSDEVMSKAGCAKRMLIQQVSVLICGHSFNMRPGFTEGLAGQATGCGQEGQSQSLFVANFFLARWPSLLFLLCRSWCPLPMKPALLSLWAQDGFLPVKHVLVCALEEQRGHVASFSFVWGCFGWLEAGWLARSVGAAARGANLMIVPRAHQHARAVDVSQYSVMGHDQTMALVRVLEKYSAAAHLSCRH